MYSIINDISMCICLVISVGSCVSIVTSVCNKLNDDNFSKKKNLHAGFILKIKAALNPLSRIF